jgi:hypothetical protein
MDNAYADNLTYGVSELAKRSIKEHAALLIERAFKILLKK